MIDRKCVQLFSLIPIVASAISAPALSAQLSPGIQLVEVASFLVPAGFEVSGGALSKSGSVVFWSRDSKSVMITDGRSTRTLCPGIALDPLAAAFTARHSFVELVDAQSGRVISVSAEGTCRFGAKLSPSGTVTAVAYSRETDEWVGLIKRNRESVLVIAGSGGRRYVRIPSGPGADVHMTHVTAMDSEVVLSSLMAPFAWSAMSLQGRIRAQGRPFATDTIVAVESVSAVSSQLLGMATRAIDNGFIQLLADPRSDLRVFVLYGSDGHRSRRTTIAVSIGLLDSDSATDQVLALRRTSTSELVLYSLRSAR